MCTEYHIGMIVSIAIRTADFTGELMSGSFMKYQTKMIYNMQGNFEEVKLIGLLEKL